MKGTTTCSQHTHYRRIHFDTLTHVLDSVTSTAYFNMLMCQNVSVGNVYVEKMLWYPLLVLWLRQ